MDSQTMEEQISEAKKRRSQLKAKLTAVSKTLQAGNLYDMSEVNSALELLHNVFHELMVAHTEYSELVNSDEQYATHRVVSNMDLDDYEACFVDIYKSAVQACNEAEREILSRSINNLSVELEEFLADDLSCTNVDRIKCYLTQCKKLSSLYTKYVEFSNSNLVKLRAIVRKLECNRDGLMNQAHVRADIDSGILRGDASRSSASFLPLPSLSHVSSIHGGVGALPAANSTRLTNGRMSFGGASNADVRQDIPQTSLQGSVYSKDKPHEGNGIELNNRSISGSGSNESQVGNTHVNDDKSTNSQKPGNTSVVSMYEGNELPPSLRPINISGGSNSFGGSREFGHVFKKSPPPVFNGKRSEWPEFRMVWSRYACHEFSSDEARAWALKNCLQNDAAECVRPIFSSHTGAYRKMWDRLEDFYGDVSLSIQSVFTELSQLTPIEEDNYRGLVKFINDVEYCYSQLGEIGAINSVSMDKVDDIADKLPRSTRLLWMRSFRVMEPREKLHPFKHLMMFLETERSSVLRLAERESLKSMALDSSNSSGTCKKNEAKTFHVESTGREDTQDTADAVSIVPRTSCAFKCIVHKVDDHNTRECRDYLLKSRNQRYQCLKNNKCCFRCLGSHMRNHCSASQVCKHCNDQNHHSTLCREDSKIKPSSTNNNSSDPTKEVESNLVDSSSVSETIFPIQTVSVSGGHSIALFFDSGSSHTFITNAAAQRVNAKLVTTTDIEMTTMGGTKTDLTTSIYQIELITESGDVVEVFAFSMDRLTSPASKLDLDMLNRLFPGFDVSSLQRCSSGVDLLVGCDYEGLHPSEVIKSAGRHLRIKRTPFGPVLQGHHPKMRVESTFCNLVGVNCLSLGVSSEVNHLHTNLTSFIQGEELGTEVQPRCGGCKCSKCPIVGHSFSFNEEQELSMIRANLKYDAANKRWVTSYPWLIDPTYLPDNYGSALAILKNTEKVLSKDETWSKVYEEQVEDMITRGVAKKLSREELNAWEGPKFYLSHLAVSNPKSTSTPVRIVFNSSQMYQGYSLNSSLAKGPDSYLNNLLGIILRWRENQVAITADIRKMYNSIFIEETEQHCHRFLWRGLDSRRDPEVYCILRVNMGDRPAGAISTEAIYKTAELFKESYPRVAELLVSSTYVDDIVDSVDSFQIAQTLAEDTEHVLSEAGFKIKSWQFSREGAPRIDPTQQSDASEDVLTKVLGISWHHKLDTIQYIPSLNFSKKKRGIYTEANLTSNQLPKEIPNILTRRKVLEQSMKVFDPLGILSPFLLQSKVLLRETWTLKLGWDEPLPEGLQQKWVLFFMDMFQMAELQFDRCMKPENSIGQPTLVIMSDGSDTAYGFVAYIRWKLKNGSYWCRLVLAKCRIAPVCKLSTPQMELNGAVLAKRGRQVLEKELRFKFDTVYHLIDSETVLNMIHKLSTRFKLYEGVRIGEIQKAGNLQDWKWISGQQNAADLLTRSGKIPRDLNSESIWWNGPKFLYLPTKEWGMKSYEVNDNPLPGEKVKVSIRLVDVAKEELDVSAFLDRFGSALKAQWVLARLLGICKGRSFASGKTEMITPGILRDARDLIVKLIQKSMQQELEKKKGKFRHLHPIKNQNGLWVIGSRMSRSNPEFNPLSTDPQIILPQKHKFTKLLLIDAHQRSGHRGRDSTLCQFRSEYWMPNGPAIAKAICRSCQKCKLRNPKLLSPKMGPIPDERLKPSPPFTFVMVDLFGPYNLRGETNKRSSSKAYGVIFTDLGSRAVHLEVVFGYDTSQFLMALTRFTSIRGWPQKMYSDPGSQLVGASNELRRVWNAVDKSQLQKNSTSNGMEWCFGPADSPWSQGAVEALVKSAKKAIHFAVCDQRISASEFLTVCAEVTNILNERPIGMLPAEDSDINVLTPNCLLLGRPTAANPGGYDRSRLRVINHVMKHFWEKWTELFAHTMIPQYKWRGSEFDRNLVVGDIVVVADSNDLRGKYYIARVVEVFPGSDGVVRKVTLEYKSFRVGKSKSSYVISKVLRIMRSVRRLALLVPV